MQSKDLSRQDKINLLRLGIGKNLLDPETEAMLLSSEPRIENELHDEYKASNLTFKFMAFKTLLIGSGVHIPSTLYFTFKFFTFNTT